MFSNNMEGNYRKKIKDKQKKNILQRPGENKNVLK